MKMFHNAENLLAAKKKQVELREYTHTIPASRVGFKGFEAGIQLMSHLISGSREDACELVIKFIIGAEKHLQDTLKSDQYMSDLAKYRLDQSLVPNFSKILISELNYENCFWNFVVDAVHYRNVKFLREFLTYLTEKRGLDLTKKLGLRHSVLGVLLEDECIKENDKTSPIGFDVLKTLIDFGLKIDVGFAVMLQAKDWLDPEVEYLLGVNAQDLFYRRCLDVVNSFLRDNNPKVVYGGDIPHGKAAKSKELSSSKGR